MKEGSLFKKLKEIQEKEPENFDLKIKDLIQDRPLSYSSLKNFLISPQNYIDYIYGEKKHETYFDVGNVFELMLLEPEKLDESVVETPNWNLRTNAGKEQKELFLEENKGKICIKSSDLETCFKMYENAINDDDVMRLVEQKQNIQQTIFWTDRETKLRNVSKIDFTTDPNESDFGIIDVKTIGTSAHENDFMRQAMNLQYHLQAGSYTLGYKNKFFQFPDYYWIVVESKEPYGVNVIKADSKLIDEGQRLYQNALQAFKYCLENNLWNDSHKFFRFMSPYYSGNLPGYYKARI